MQISPGRYTKKRYPLATCQENVERVPPSALLELTRITRHTRKRLNLVDRHWFRLDSHTEEAKWRHLYTSEKRTEVDVTSHSCSTLRIMGKTQTEAMLLAESGRTTPGAPVAYADPLEWAW